MDSVRTILIRTCMTQIQKELTHLEHWLIHLPEDTHVSSASASASVSAYSPSDRILSALESLTKQVETQQVTLHHVVDRLAVLESVKEVHIESEDPWMGDEPTPFVHEEEDTTMYLVHKSEHSSPSTPKAEADVHDVVYPIEVQPEPVKEVVIPIEVQPAPEPEPEPEPVQEVVIPVEVQEVVIPIEVQPAPAPEPVKEVVIPVEVQPEPVKEVVIPIEVQPVPVKEVVIPVEVQSDAKQEEQVKEQEKQKGVEPEEEEEEEEEEEDGVELEEVVYQGVTYYRDPEQFIYSVNEEGDISEEPIGYWKGKTKSIAFYHKK